eukprot:TRINITY_DN12392_c0_g5_i1.p1 TRINITY_DN12392_c0_g5~~TRINITY_DN12392_c0_g5_i1.p1  ORF type:complete len:218 (-),score=45.51 TRINITY_DN12392_c0_g5_i1:161-721(-)
MAAVRALSRRMPTPPTLAAPPFRRSYKQQGEASMGKYKTMDEEEGGEQPSFNLRSTTYDSAFSDERVLEADVFSDNVQGESDDEDVSSEASEPVQVATRTRTLSCDGDFPDTSAYLDPEWIKNYNKLYLSDDASSDEESDYAEESDTDEMYSGPLKPVRTTARRDFPHPTAYLSKEELVEMWSSFS